MSTARPRRVFITAAEVSGDKHAAQLIKALRQLEPDVHVEGHGGPEMAAAGATLHRETVGRAAMGLRGALRAAEMYGVLRWTRRHFDRHPPDLFVGVDSPSLNFHFAKAAKRRGIPVLQYVAPQLWAWAEWRMKKLRRRVDHLACILPFEEEYFRRHGVSATFVGHPLFDELPADRGREGRRKPEGTYGDYGGHTLPGGGDPVVGLLPGSRKSEAQANFPRLLRTAARIIRALPDATFLVPTTPATDSVVADHLHRGGVLEATRAAAHATARFANAFDEIVPGCDLCLTVSGTATLHVASFGVPMIVVYAGSRLAWNLAGRWLIPARTFSLVNLLALNDPAAARAAKPADHLVPEFIPWYGPVDAVAEMAIDWLRDPATLDEQSRRLRSLVNSLDRPGASLNVARIALRLMDARRADHQPPPPSPPPSPPLAPLVNSIDT